MLYLWGIIGLVDVSFFPATATYFSPIKAKVMPFSYSKQMTFNVEWAKISPVPHVRKEGVVLKKSH